MAGGVDEDMELSEQPSVSLWVGGLNAPPYCPTSGGHSAPFERAQVMPWMEMQSLEH